MDQLSVSGKYNVVLNEDISETSNYTVVEKKYKNSNKRKLFAIATVKEKWTLPEVQRYGELHRKLMDELVNTTESDARPFLMCIYDVSQLQALPTPAQIVCFAAMHNDYRPFYTQYLRGSLVVSSDSLNSEFLNPLVEVYQGIAPVKFIDSNQNLQQEIRGFWRACGDAQDKDD